MNKIRKTSAVALPWKDVSKPCTQLAKHTLELSELVGEGGGGIIQITKLAPPTKKERIEISNYWKHDPITPWQGALLKNQNVLAKAVINLGDVTCSIKTRKTYFSPCNLT